MACELPRVLFCNTAWMNAYQGRTDIDPPYNGGSWVRRSGTGSEIYNFYTY